MSAYLLHGVSYLYVCHVHKKQLQFTQLVGYIFYRKLWWVAGRECKTAGCMLLRLRTDSLIKLERIWDTVLRLFVVVVAQ
jgi:hypothetical protein